MLLEAAVELGGNFQRQAAPFYPERRPPQTAGNLGIGVPAQKCVLAPQPAAARPPVRDLKRNPFRGDLALLPAEPSGNNMVRGCAEDRSFLRGPQSVDAN